VLALAQDAGRCQSLLDYEALERREPVLVVPRAVVRLAPIGSRTQFSSERRGPFLPGEVPLLGQPDRERKRLRLPRLGERGTFRVARQRRESIERPFEWRALRHAQGSLPTGRRRRRRVTTPARPIVLARGTGPCRRVARGRRARC